MHDLICQQHSEIGLQPPQSFLSSLYSISPSSGDLLSFLQCSSLSLQHETVQSELREKQEDMDQLISTVEDLQRELEKVPNSDMCFIQKDMKTLRDQWLEVSDAQTNMPCHIYVLTVKVCFSFRQVQLYPGTIGLYLSEIKRVL